MNLFSYVKSQLSILDVIGDYTKLKKAGTYWKAHCPFHHEKTASFTVSPHKEIFYCFGCHIGGDLISFIAKIENCTQLEATQHLIDRYQLEIPENITKTKIHDINEKNRYFHLCKSIAQWCHEMLQKSPYVRHYLHERGINDKSIETFEIGYFPDGLKAIRALTMYMHTKSILIDDLKEARIITEGKNVFYSPFENRIIFPIKDHLGRFCGFGGRIFKQHDPRAKYYNSHENNYFNKGSLLFGLNCAKKTIQKTEELFLVEGYTDCIAMVQHGFDNTIATLGTSCTSEHLKILARYVHKIYILYDGDCAGEKAIMRLTELCWQVNIDLMVIPLPHNEDPASFLLKGGAIKNLLDKAVDIFTFFIQTLGKEFSSKPLAQKIQLVQKLLAIVHNIPGQLKRDIILQKAAETFRIPLDSLQAEAQKTSRREYIEKRKTAEALNNLEQNNSEKSKIILEKKILFAILNNISLFNENNEDYLITWLPDPLSSILKKLKGLKGQLPSKTPDFPQLFDHLDAPEKQYVSGILIQAEEPVDQQPFDLLFAQFQKKIWKHIVRKIKLKLEQAEQKQNTQEVETILRNFSKLKKKLLNKNLTKRNNE